MVDLEIMRHYTHVDTSSKSDTFIKADNVSAEDVDSNAIKEHIAQNQSKGDSVNLAFGGINFISINRENLSKIEDKFGKSTDKGEYYEASNEAKEYLAGWLASLNRNTSLSSADKDGDGVITLEESQDIKNFVDYDPNKGEFVFRSANELGLEMSFEDEASANTKFMTTSDILNLHIDMDKNLDGKITTDENKLARDIKDGISAMSKHNAISQYEEQDSKKKAWEEYQKRKKELEERLQELNKAMSKLMQSNKSDTDKLEPKTDHVKSVENPMEEGLDKQVLKTDENYEEVASQLQGAVITDEKVEQVSVNNDISIDFVADVAKSIDAEGISATSLDNAMQQTGIEQIMATPVAPVTENSTKADAVSSIRAQIESVQGMLMGLASPDEKTGIFG
jgi:predicted transcriptional regulator